MSPRGSYSQSGKRHPVELFTPGTPIVDRRRRAPGRFIERRYGFYYCEMDDGDHGLYMRSEIRHDLNATRHGLGVGDIVFFGLSTHPWIIRAMREDGTVDVQSPTGTNERRFGVALDTLTVRPVKRGAMDSASDLRFEEESVDA